MVNKSCQKAAESVTPQIIMDHLCNNPTGNIRSGWRLFPSHLPEQIFKPYSGGKIVALYEGKSEQNVYSKDSLTHDKELTILPESSLTILLDLEEYFYGYPQIALNGGMNRFVQMNWGESLI